MNRTMLYNGSNTKLTLQAYGGTTGASYGSKIIVNGGGTGGGNISFINDNITTCVMNSSGVGINTTPGSYALNVNGNTYINSNTGIGITNPNS
jgi:hypothetical protein